MAFDVNHLLESVVPAVITGGGTAISTILAFFRDIKKKVEELEKKVGSFESKAGLIYGLHVLEESVKRLKEAVEQIQQRDSHTTGGPWGRPRSISNEYFPWDDIRNEIQELVKKELNYRLTNVDDRLDKIDQKLKKLVSEDDFEQADRARADEIAEVRTTMAEVRGLLQGLQSALGLIKPTRG